MMEGSKVTKSCYAICMDTHQKRDKDWEEELEFEISRPGPVGNDAAQIDDVDIGTETSARFADSCANACAHMHVCTPGRRQIEKLYCSTRLAS